MNNQVSRPLAGQTAIVTGASSGIGAAIAIAFAEAGAVVGVNHHGDLAGTQAVLDAAAKAGGEAMPLEADVSDEAAVAKMVEEFTRKHRRLDIMVANAGIQRDARFTEMSLADWRRVIGVNLTGQFLCAREAVRHFRRQGVAGGVSRAAGKIICMSSVHQVIPWAGHVNYATSKGGVQLFMMSLAQEVAPDRIRVNAIAPGAIKTGINRAAWSTPEAEKRLLTLIPYGRVGIPEDIAKAALWLASDESDYVTGTTLFVDGGMTLYPAFAGNG